MDGLYKGALEPQINRVVVDKKLHDVTADSEGFNISKRPKESDCDEPTRR